MSNQMTNVESQSPDVRHSAAGPSTVLRHSAFDIRRSYRLCLAILLAIAFLGQGADRVWAAPFFQLLTNSGSEAAMSGWYSWVLPFPGTSNSATSTFANVVGSGSATVTLTALTASSNVAGRTRGLITNSNQSAGFTEASLYDGFSYPGNAGTLQVSMSGAGVIAPNTVYQVTAIADDAASSATGTTVYFENAAGGYVLGNSQAASTITLLGNNGSQNLVNSDSRCQLTFDLTSNAAGVLSFLDLQGTAANGSRLNGFQVTALSSTTFTWAATGGGSLLNAANWDSNGVPSGSAPTVIFGNSITAPATVTLDSSPSFGSLTFSNSNNYGYTLSAGSGGTLTLDGLVTVSNGSNVISASVALSGSNAFTISSAAALNVSAAISGSGAIVQSGSGLLVLTGSNGYSGITTISGGTLQLGAGRATGSLSTSSTITDNATLVFSRSNTAAQGTDFTAIPITGNGRLVQMGPGTLTLNSANSYSGGTTIGAGTLQITNGSALGSGAVTLSGGTLATSGALTVSNSLTIAASTGAVVVSGSAAWTGNISGPGGLTLGGGLLSLSGVNTYQGPTVVSAGTLQLHAPTPAPLLPAGTKIMPVGDSITLGHYGTNDGYRGFLYDDLIAAGFTTYQFQLVGTTNQLEAGMTEALPSTPVNQTFHDGWSGWTTGLVLGNSTSSGNIGTWLPQLAGNGSLPTIITLDIGTNDAGTGVALSQGTANLSAIISTIFQKDPKVLLLLGEVTPRTDNASYNTWINQYNAFMPGLVTQYSASGDNIELVNLNTNFPVSNGLNTDGLHPIDTGYNFMATQWFNAIMTYATVQPSGSGGAIQAVPSTSPMTVAMGAVLSLEGSQASIGPLSGGGSIINSASGDPVTLTVDQSGTTSFGGTIGDGNSQTSLTLTGGGKLYLSGTNTYSGLTTVAGGELIAADGAALSSGDNLAVGGDLRAFGSVIPAAATSPPVAAAPVPEPGTLALAAALLGVAASYRRLRCRRRVVAECVTTTQAG
jgi:fibronectin-binding autotransporter adhesin